MKSPQFDITTLPGFESVVDRSPDRDRERAIIEEHRALRPGHVFASPDLAVFRFANGYGGGVLMGTADHPACSVTTPDSPFEMAVLHTDATGDRLCYATPVTSDVICPLDAQGVASTLSVISMLPRRDDCDHALRA